MKETKAMTTPKVNTKSRRVFEALELADRCQTKLASLKHGYIADDDFVELKEAIGRI